VGYAVENALFQWEEGERRLRESDELEREDLEEGVAAVEDEIRRRLGSSFTIGELADLYGAGVDWATELAQARLAGTDAAAVADAAFARYARQATNYAGGQPVDRPERFED
jgi:hypothetical protein